MPAQPPEMSGFRSSNRGSWASCGLGACRRNDGREKKWDGQSRNVGPFPDLHTREGAQESRSGTSDASDHRVRHFADRLLEKKREPAAPATAAEDGRLSPRRTRSSGLDRRRARMTRCGGWRPRCLTGLRDRPSRLRGFQASAQPGQRGLPRVRCLRSVLEVEDMAGIVDD